MKQRMLRQLAPSAKETAKLLDTIAHRSGRSLSEVFFDAVQLSAIAIANATDLLQKPAREARYLDIMRGYPKEAAREFPGFLARLVLELEKGFADVLGHLFGALELLNEGRGQFFTPYHLSHMMARIAFHDSAKDIVEEHGFIKACEPACGAGGMVIAMAHACEDIGINYQRELHVTAIDIDPRCVWMTFLQASLYHIPAAIYLANALSSEPAHEVWYTPAHIFGRWSHRLASRERTELEDEWWRAAGMAERIQFARDHALTEEIAAEGKLPESAREAKRIKAELV